MAQNIYSELTSGQATKISTDLFPVNIAEELYKEWVQLSPLIDFMGTSPYSIIHKQPMKKGRGARWGIPKLRALDYKKPVMDFELTEGRAQQQIVDSFFIDCRRRSFSVQVDFDPILDYAVPFNILNPIARELADTNARNLNWSIITGYTTDLYPNILTANCNVAGTLPSYDRAVSALAATNTRNLWQANQTFPTYLNNFQNTTNTTPAGTGLSVAHLRKLIKYATFGGSQYGIEPTIMPSSLESKNGWPMNKYVYLMTMESYASLCQDPEFSNTALTRGVVVAPNTPNLITGGFFKGEFEGVLLYVVPELSDQIILSQDGTKSISWNLFLGGGSYVIGWGDITNFGQKNDIENMIRKYFSHDFRGQGVPAFTSRYVENGGAVAGSNPLVEQSVIHSFVSNKI